MLRVLAEGVSAKRIYLEYVISIRCVMSASFRPSFHPHCRAAAEARARMLAVVGCERRTTLRNSL